VSCSARRRGVVINVVQLGGALVSDPDLRDTQSGAFCAEVTVACKSVRYDRVAGVDVIDQVFARVIAWEDTAEVLARLVAGTVVLVTGQLTQQAVTRDGHTERKTKVRALVVQVVRTPPADRAVVSFSGDDSYPG
jgi:single-stranded DNA-binding protein